MNSQGGMNGFNPATGSDMPPSVAPKAPLMVIAKNGRKLAQKTCRKIGRAGVAEGRYRTQSGPLKRKDNGFEAMTAAAVRKAAPVVVARCACGAAAFAQSTLPAVKAITTSSATPTSAANIL